jgi:solute carrier family 25, member 42
VPVEVLPEPPRQLGRGARFATHLCAGALAGATAKTIEAPLDRVKIIFQVSKQPFSFRAAGRQMVAIVRNEGVQGLWKGNGEATLRQRARALRKRR